MHINLNDAKGHRLYTVDRLEGGQPPDIIRLGKRDFVRIGAGTGFREAEVLKLNAKDVTRHGNITTDADEDPEDDPKDPEDDPQDPEKPKRTTGK